MLLKGRLLMHLLLLLGDISCWKKNHVRLDVADRFLWGHLIALFLWINTNVHSLEDESHQVINLLNSLIYRMFLYMLHGMVFFVIDRYFARIFPLGSTCTWLFLTFHLLLWFWGCGSSTKAGSSRLISRWVHILKSLHNRLAGSRAVNTDCFLNTVVLFEEAIWCSCFNRSTNNLLINQR